MGKIERGGRQVPKTLGRRNALRKCKGSGVKIGKARSRGALIREIGSLTTGLVPLSEKKIQETRKRSEQVCDYMGKVLNGRGNKKSPEGGTSG